MSNHPLSHARATVRSVACLVTALVTALLLAACSGGDGQAPAEPPALSGIASSGFRMLSEFSVRGSTGTPRTLGLSTQGDGRYRLALDDLAPPYVLRALTPLTGEVYHALATEPGTTHVTPLTELVAAATLGEAPASFYDGLREGVSDPARVTPAALRQAEQQVRLVLELRMGLPVPDALMPFGQASFTTEPADPMTQLMRRMRQQLVDQGRLLSDLVGDLAEDSARCGQEALQLTLGARSDRFCPSAKRTEPDADEADITVHGFNNVYGDTLQLRLRGDTLLDLQLVHAGRSFGCEGAACAGVTVAPPDGSGVRAISLASTTLVGDAGGAVLQGTLAAGQGALPQPCVGVPMSLGLPGGDVEQRCVARRLATSKFGRVAHAFLAKSDRSWMLNVIVEGDQVVWVSVGDPNLGGVANGGVRWRCKNEACAGAVAGPLQPDGTRRIELNAVQLGQVAEDGSFDAATTAALTASLTTTRLQETPLPTCDPPDGVLFTNSDGTVRRHCAATLALNPSWEDLDGDGVPETFFGSLIDVPRFTITLDVLNFNAATGQVDEVVLKMLMLNGGELEQPMTVHYRCRGDCTGVQATLDGETTRVSFDGTVLREVDPDGDEGDRRVVVSGGLP